MHDLGEDEDGDQVTTCTIEPVDDETMKEAKGKKVTGTNQNLILQCFTNLRGEGVGKPNPAGAGWPNPREFWAIPEEALKDHALGKLSDKKNPHHAYKTAVNSLIKSGHMQRNEGHLWITGKNGRYSE